MGSPHAKSQFEFTGGHLGLDFTNTVDNRTGDLPQDQLTSYADLLRWGQAAGAVTRKQAEQLQQAAGGAPGHAQSALRHAAHLREAIYAIFSAVADRRGIPGAALGQLNAAVQQASEHARIVHSNRRFRWEWISPEEDLNSVTWPIVRAAADLLVSDDLTYVRQCASETCGWLFLDQTKNHRRRWCDMKTCGNRDKARRYYQRQKR